MRFIFTVPVWGESYVSQFLELSLPTLLAKGNLVGFPGIEDSIFLVVTTPESEPKFHAAASFRELRRLLPVEFALVPDLESGDKYNTASYCQSLALRRTQSFGGLCFLYADMIWAEGSLCAAAARLEEGYEAVFTPGPPVLADRFPAALLERAERVADFEGTTRIRIGARELVQASLPNLHPGMTSYLWDGAEFTTTPAYLTFSAPDDGLLVHAFHLHPVLMKIQHDNPTFYSPIEVSLDEEFVTGAYPCTDRVYCVPDSDEIAMVSLMDPGAMQTGRLPRGRRPDAAFIARWAEDCTSPVHREFLRHPYRIHSRDLDVGAWASVEKRARSIIDEITRRLALPDSVLAYEDLDAHAARRRRGRRLRKARKGTVDRLPPAHRQAMDEKGLLRFAAINLKSLAVRRSPRLGQLLTRIGQAPWGSRLRSGILGAGPRVADPPPVPSWLILKEAWRARGKRHRVEVKPADRDPGEKAGADA